MAVGAPLLGRSSGDRLCWLSSASKSRPREWLGESCSCLATREAPWPLDSACGRSVRETSWTCNSVTNPGLPAAWPHSTSPSPPSARVAGAPALEVAAASQANVPSSCASNIFACFMAVRSASACQCLRCCDACIRRPSTASTALAERRLYSAKSTGSSHFRALYTSRIDTTLLISASNNLQYIQNMAAEVSHANNKADHWNWPILPRHLTMILTPYRSCMAGSLSCGPATPVRIVLASAFWICRTT
mmetsp:Transcript_80206/g.221780  ORF Transcript_80206/g.221780 Transcript_80206/m.221780 type:complete len:247 (+) Transcript_80206:482-1222(+)